MNKRNNLSTSSIVIAGLMAAISIILTRFFSIMVLGDTLRLSFGDMPIELAGILLGPIVGALTGIVADLAGFMMRSTGGFFPGFTLSAALTGLIPGLIFWGNKDRYPLWKVIVAIVAVNLIVCLGLNTLWLTIMYKKGFMILLPSRIIARAIIAPIDIAVIYLLLQKIRIKR